MSLPTPQYFVGNTFRTLTSPLINGSELCLTVSGIERCAADQYYGPTVRPDHHVHFILDGKGTYEVNGKTYHLHRGQIFVTFPGALVYYYADPEDPWYYTYLSFSGTKASLYLEKAGITAADPVRDCFLEPEDFLAFTSKIFERHELTITNELMRNALLYEALALLVDSYNKHLAKSHQPAVPDYPSSYYVEHAVRYIHDNYAKVRGSDVASYIGITRSYLTHMFQQKLLVSPQKYIVNYRLEQGRLLLQNTDLPVQEVAERIGYEDPLTFSKMFKNTYGKSPKKYREQLRGERGEGSAR